MAAYMHMYNNVTIWNGSSQTQFWHFSLKACSGAGRTLSVLLAVASVSIAPALLTGAWMHLFLPRFRSNPPSMQDLRERTAGDPTRAFRGWTPGLRACRAPVQQRPTAPNIVKMAEGGKRRRNLRLYNEWPLMPTAHAHNVNWACVNVKHVQLTFCPPEWACLTVNVTAEWQSREKVTNYIIYSSFQ